MLNAYLHEKHAVAGQGLATDTNKKTLVANNQGHVDADHVTSAQAVEELDKEMHAMTDPEILRKGREMQKR